MPRQRTGNVRRFLGLVVVPKPPPPSLPAAESIRRMSPNERAWAMREGYVREVAPNAAGDPAGGSRP
jgi:hypothetical protein